MKVSRTARRLVIGAVAVLVSGLTMVVVNQPEPASAHGSVTNPPSRNYGCWDRWGDDHLNPNMAQTDPMCAQAWQANPNTMWNWNGLYRENVGGNHQAAVPDGQLCSGGRTQGGLYASLDTVGAWVAKPMPNNFTLTLTDGARHGADYMLIYITKQGFNPATQPLTWGSLDLVLRTGSYPTTGLYEAQVNAGSRTGRHVVYTIWQASHLDQPYYLCSDVTFGGGGTDPTNPPTTPPTTPPPTVPPTTPPTTPPTGNGGCSATYAKTSEWTGGFGATVTVRAGTAAIAGWTVRWTWANGQSITSSWNATVTSSGSSITAANVSHNGALSANGSTSFGFNGSWTGTNTAPTLTCTAR
ncbi:lytic polysaccharide monooxygenase auxiliary activity family 9 protein [Plantactinospora soyae]|uniref:Chitin-binding protein n=1 Tax=Plantactinospora soyae TaxID=1544732 RepID=A0A927M7G6_9ACTN|nr:lytic polysaccharide monooxygenase [Plantactinospora soyae]MBE1489399.1 chitin-binding protein [Plantactinospora soyae]